ncbi:hypothetical protein IWW38_005448, partial [Coemansia aciculifera]
MIDLEEAESGSTAVDVTSLVSGPVVFSASSSSVRGWTGAAVRDIMVESVHRVDRQAQIKYQAFPKSGHYTCQVTVTWSHPSKAKRSTQRRPIPNAATEVFEPLDALKHAWSVPSSLVVGATARDARDLAALVYLYTQDAVTSVGVLPPALAALWMQWDAALKLDEERGKAAREKARAEFLARLWADYLLHGQQQPKEGGGEEPVQPPTRAKTDGGGVSAVRTRMWGPQTIGDRRKQRKALASDELPARQFGAEIRAALREHRVCIVRGETGSGKSSQVPQYAVEQMLSTGSYKGGRVLCTQPRRLSALAIATRVSQELGDAAVGGSGALVGYQIRFDARASESNALVFCTTGVLLRRLASDPDLRGVACVICDEVQERTLELDFLLILMRRLLERRRDFRLVLMSATVDADAFACYFDACPVVDIPGRAFPVASVYLPQLVHMS